MWGKLAIVGPFLLLQFLFCFLLVCVLLRSGGGGSGSFFLFSSSFLLDLLFYLFAEIVTRIKVTESKIKE